MLLPLIRSALTVAGSRRLSVLIYHRIPAEPDALLPDEPDARSFEQTMRWIRDAFNVIPLAEGVGGLKSGRLPPRALSITFDDGYANNATVAAPILKRLGLHATFFIATGYLDGGRMFNDAVVEGVRHARGPQLDLGILGLGVHSVATIDDRRATIGALLDAIKYRSEGERAECAERIAQIAGAPTSPDLMMTSEQAASVARDGFELGGHTVTHPILAQLDLASAREEIECGRDRVGELAGRPVRLFAYPNGRPHRDYVAATRQLVEDLGFEGAVSTSRGAARIGSDPFEVPRFTPWVRTPLRFCGQMLDNIARSAPQYVHA